jgi:hypothetical protein
MFQSGNQCYICSYIYIYLLQLCWWAEPNTCIHFTRLLVSSQLGLPHNKFGLSTVPPLEFSLLAVSTAYAVPAVLLLWLSELALTVSDQL